MLPNQPYDTQGRHWPMGHLSDVHFLELLKLFGSWSFLTALVIVLAWCAAILMIELWPGIARFVLHIL